MLTLSAGALVCEIEPRLGGCIAGLRLDGVPVLRPAPSSGLVTSRQSGSYPLVPFSNRIQQATLQWRGTQHPLVRNNAPEPHAIHGVGWQRPWSVLDSGDAFALLAYEHRADSSWPFAFDSSQSFRVTPQSLEMTLSVTNQSGQAAPCGLGWHPYFVKRPGSRIRFQAQGRWEMGDDKLPTRLAPSTGLDADCSTLDVDHCFQGWDGAAELEDSALRVRIRSSLRWLVVFTNGSREFIAVEPVSHVNDAVSRVAAGNDAAQLGLTILAPGATLSAQMTLEVEPA